jgi:hypothetical protein
MVDASKLTSLATNFISTTVPQDPASSIIVPLTARLPNVHSNLDQLTGYVVIQMPSIF